jgi:hypothetical protein
MLWMSFRVSLRSMFSVGRLARVFPRLGRPGQGQSAVPLLALMNNVIRSQTGSLLGLCNYVVGLVLCGPARFSSWTIPQFEHDASIREAFDWSGSESSVHKVAILSSSDHGSDSS